MKIKYNLLFSFALLFLVNLVFCMEEGFFTGTGKLGREKEVRELQSLFNFNQYKSETFCREFDIDQKILNFKDALEIIKIGKFLLAVFPGSNCKKIVFFNLDKNTIEQEIKLVVNYCFYKNGKFLILELMNSCFFIIDCENCEIIKKFYTVEAFDFISNKNLIIVKRNNGSVEIFKLQKDSQTNTTYECVLLKVFNDVKGIFKVFSDKKSLMIKKKNVFLSKLLSCLTRCLPGVESDGDIFEKKVIDLEDEFFGETKICRKFKAEFEDLGQKVFELIKNKEILITHNFRLHTLKIIKKNGESNEFFGVIDFKTLFVENYLFLLFNNNNRKLPYGTKDTKIIDIDNCVIINEFKKMQKCYLVEDYLVMIVGPDRFRKDCIIFDVKSNKIINNYENVEDFENYSFLNKIFIVVSFKAKPSVVEVLELSRAVEESLLWDKGRDLKSLEKDNGAIKTELQNVPDTNLEKIVLYKLLEANKTFRQNLLAKRTKRQFCDVVIRTGGLQPGDPRPGDDLRSGYSQSGDLRSGYLRSGYSQSGDLRSGDLRSGYSQSGDSQFGYSQSGDQQFDKIQDLPSISLTEKRFEEKCEEPVDGSSFSWKKDIRNQKFF